MSDQHAKSFGYYPPVQRHCHHCYCGNIELKTDAKSDFVHTIFCVFPSFPGELLRERIGRNYWEMSDLYYNDVSITFYTKRVRIRGFYIEIVHSFQNQGQRAWWVIVRLGQLSTAALFLISWVKPGAFTPFLAKNSSLTPFLVWFTTYLTYFLILFTSQDDVCFTTCVRVRNVLVSSLGRRQGSHTGHIKGKNE